MLNITFDLETLGTTHQAPIVQIGAVKFDDNGNIFDTFTSYVSLNSLDDYPSLKSDYRTIAWWLEQSKDAIDSVFNNKQDRVSLEKALGQLTTWLNTDGNPNDYCYWTHATFDPPILNFNYQAVGLKSALPYRKQRDIRTLMDLYKRVTGKDEVPVSREGVHHNALDDCIYQAKYIGGALAAITNR